MSSVLSVLVNEVREKGEPQTATLSGGLVLRCRWARVGVLRVSVSREGTCPGDLECGSMARATGFGVAKDWSEPVWTGTRCERWIEIACEKDE